MRSTSKYQAGRSFAQILLGSKTQLHPLDLAPGGVYLATAVTCGTGGLLHHRFTLTKVSLGGLFSVALSRGMHSGWALPTTLPCGVRTFLDPLIKACRDHPSRLVQVQHYALADHSIPTWTPGNALGCHDVVSLTSE